MKPSKLVAVLFGTIALVTYLSYQAYPSDDAVTVSVPVQPQSYALVYVIDQERMLVPIHVPIQTDETIEEQMEVLFSYLNGKQTIDNFEPIFKKEIDMPKIEIKNRCMKFLFNDEFKEYKPEYELQVLQALVFTATHFPEIDSIELYVNQEKLAAMPQCNTPLNYKLNRAIGINVFDSETKHLHDTDMMTIYYTKQIHGKEYIIPRSKRVADTLSIKNRIKEICKDAKQNEGLEQPLYDHEVKIQDVTFKNHSLQVDVNTNIVNKHREINQKLVDLLQLSLAEIEGVEEIEITVDKINVQPRKKTIVKRDKVLYNIIVF